MKGSLIATIWMWGMVRAALRTSLPMRPNPLIPTLIGADLCIIYNLINDYNLKKLIYWLTFSDIWLFNEEEFKINLMKYISNVIYNIWIYYLLFKIVEYWRSYEFFFFTFASRSDDESFCVDSIFGDVFIWMTYVKKKLKYIIFKQ